MTDEHPKHEPEAFLGLDEVRDLDLDDQPPVDEEFVHARLDELEELLGDPLLPLATRLAARDSIRKIRAELDPTLATEGDG